MPATRVEPVSLIRDSYTAEWRIQPAAMPVPYGWVEYGQYETRAEALAIIASATPPGAQP